MGHLTSAFQATQKGGPFTLAKIPAPCPEQNEIAIRIKAVGLNPLDWKKLYTGAMVESWPATLGIDGAGVVEAVGPGVSAFKPGDQVFSLFGHSARASSFQEVAIVPQHFAAKMPRGLSFEEAASLPICYCTAAAAVSYGLGIDLPYLSKSGAAASTPRSVLVLGGSSGVGAAALQLLRLALPDAVILTTSSLRHASHLTSLGATRVFDYNSQTLIQDIKSATPAGNGVDMIIDAVAGSASQSDIFEALDPNGPKKCSEVFTGTPTNVPESVHKVVVFGRKIFEVQRGECAMAGLADLIDQGKYKLPQKVHSVGEGFDRIPDGLAQLKDGVSGTKLVVCVA